MHTPNEFSVISLFLRLEILKLELKTNTLNDDVYLMNIIWDIEKLLKIQLTKDELKNVYIHLLNR